MKFLMGLILGIIVWFPYGIYYTVQASDSSKLVKFISTIKGLIEL